MKISLRRLRMLPTACGFMVAANCALVMAQDAPRVLPGVRSVIRSATEPSAPEGETTLTSAVEQGGDPTDAELVTERYSNGAVKTQRWVILDADGNYVNHGSFKAYDQNGKLQGSGEYRHGKEHGKWTRVLSLPEGTFVASGLDTGFEAPFLSEAPLVDGQLHGTWTVRDKAGRLVLQWQFENGVRQGSSSWWYSSGPKRTEMTYKDGLMHGKLVSYRADQQPEVKAIYADGRRLTSKTEVYPKGGQKMSEGSYLSPPEAIETYYDWWNLVVRTTPAAQDGPGVKHGPWTYWHPNGKVRMQGEYKEDLPVGKFTWWYENGQKQAEGEYVQGQQNGMWIGWHPNGMKKYKGDYAQGAQSGVWMVWKEDGRRSEIHEYDGNDSRVEGDSIPATESIVTDELPYGETYDGQPSIDVANQPEPKQFR